jgi:hypothetical protein
MKPRPSMTKRQREQTKRDKKAAKAERRAQRKSERETAAAPSTEEEAN